MLWVLLNVVSHHPEHSGTIRCSLASWRICILEHVAWVFPLSAVPRSPLCVRSLCESILLAGHPLSTGLATMRCATEGAWGHVSALLIHQTLHNRRGSPGPPEVVSNVEADETPFLPSPYGASVRRGM